MTHREGRRGGQTSDRGSLGDVGRIDCFWPTYLGGEQPDRAAADQISEGVHQGVDEVTISLAPPQDHCLDDIAVIAVDEVGIDCILDGLAHRVVNVVVPAKLLDNHPLGQAKAVAYLVIRACCARSHRVPRFQSVMSKVVHRKWGPLCKQGKTTVQ